MQLRVTRWVGSAPDEAILRSQYAAEGLRPYQWVNSLGDRYAAHAHPYHKVLYVLRGSIALRAGAEHQHLRSAGPW
jgi:hypothetical protein